VRIIELQPQPARGAGAFTLRDTSGAAPAAASLPGPAHPDDVALVLHTSGTTSRPKIVPLSQRNVCASARNIRGFLSLGATDRGLNIMPLFHIHGLIAGMLAPLSAGGQVCCTPGFNALKFFAWMEEARPTWYTAVPTMHQTILSTRSQQQGGDRVQSAALHPLVVVGDADAGDPRDRGHLRCTAGRVLRHDRGGASDGSEPAATRGCASPATVGIAAGPEVAIMDDQGALLPPARSAKS
jgi:acyl-CoA synthetase (AMP-forming)/AMP-acid ligase II